MSILRSLLTHSPIVFNGEVIEPGQILDVAEADVEKYASLIEAKLIEVVDTSYAEVVSTIHSVEEKVEEKVQEVVATVKGKSKKPVPVVVEEESTTTAAPEATESK